MMEAKNNSTKKKKKKPSIKMTIIEIDFIRNLRINNQSTKEQYRSQS
jgi:hypothetical protein